MTGTLAHRKKGHPGMANRKRYIYEHPAEAGLGEHHADRADGDLSDRPLYPGAPQDWPPGRLTMAGMDLAHGTEVTLRLHEPGHGQPPADNDGTERDERGLVVVEWADAHGHGRATSVSQQFFAQHFREVGKS